MVSAKGSENKVNLTLLFLLGGTPCSAPEAEPDCGAERLPGSPSLQAEAEQMLL